MVEGWQVEVDAKTLDEFIMDDHFAKDYTFSEIKDAFKRGLMGDYGNTLNKTDARGEKDEKHVCPLQLETIERAVRLWSNKHDTVLTPFMGIGSEVYQSILCERNGIGFELKESYFNEAVKNVQTAEAKMREDLLF